MGIKSRRPKFVFDDGKVPPLKDLKNRPVICPCCGQFVRPGAKNKALSLEEKERCIREFLEAPNDP